MAFDQTKVGRRAVIVGAEHVSFSAVLTLAHAGCRTVALVTELPRHQTYRALEALTSSRHRAPVLTGVGIARIEGRRRVEAVELTNGRRLACDTVVFTGDWIPDHELVRRAGLQLAGTAGPVVDAGLRTERPGVFAAGNLLHGAETADVCALDGRHVARPVIAWLADGRWPSPGLPIVAEPPLRWVHPSVVRPADPPPSRGRYLLRTGDLRGRPSPGGHPGRPRPLDRPQPRPARSQPLHRAARWMGAPGGPRRPTGRRDHGRLALNGAVAGWTGHCAGVAEWQTRRV